MINKPGIWQTSSNGSVFRLAKTGNIKRDPETKELVEELANDFSMSISYYDANKNTINANSDKKIQLAKHIAKLLNEYPLED